MKRTIMALMVLMVTLCAVESASAGTYFFTPTPRPDIWDLDHYNYFRWGINWNQTNEVIVEAVLSFRNIWDWIVEPGDSLYTHLLDDPRNIHGTRMDGWISTSYDYQGNGDAFLGQGFKLDTWSDPYGGRPRNFDLTYRFSEINGALDALNAYAADGYFGFGFDPDCHYFNDGISITITTAERPKEAIPEPATLGLFGLGAAGIAALRRRRKSA